MQSGASLGQRSKMTSSHFPISLWSGEFGTCKTIKGRTVSASSCCLAYSAQTLEMSRSLSVPRRKRTVEKVARLIWDVEVDRVLQKTRFLRLFRVHNDVGHFRMPLHLSNRLVEPLHRSGDAPDNWDAGDGA